MTGIKTLRNGSVSDGKIAADVFGTDMHPVVLREAVLMYEANRRTGTVNTLSRRFVSGSSKKMYKQKHTGRARHGDKKAPLMRGGGVAHGPHPRDFSYRMPRKALRRALQVALATKVRDGEVCAWSGAAFDAPSTRKVVQALNALGTQNKVGIQNALIVSPGPVDANLLLSIRNLRRVRALPAGELSAYDIVAHDHLVLLDGALDALKSRLAAGASQADAEGSDA